jgi:hypothetical protein
MWAKWKCHPVCSHVKEHMHTVTLATMEEIPGKSKTIPEGITLNCDIKIKCSNLACQNQ